MNKNELKILAEKLFGPLEVPEVGYQLTDQDDETEIIEADDETRMWW